MKILHVMTEFPCPPNDGIRADIWSRLRSMSRLGYSIDVLVMKSKVMPEERHIAQIRGLVNRLHFVERRPLLRCLATVTPTDVVRNGMLADVQLTEHYDLTLAERDSAFPIFNNPRLKTKLRVLGIHDNEVTRMRASAQAEERLLKRQLYRLEALRFGPFSRSAYHHVDSLWFSSQSECQQFRATQTAVATRAEWLPPAIEFGNEPKRYGAQSKRVLYVASLHIPLNREALRWYLKQIHVRLAQDPDYQLVVAGSTRGGGARGGHFAQLFAEEIRREKRCSVHVDVEDLTSLYDDCSVFVNPMQRGAGIKVKNLHAIERRLPVVTTSVGNDGSGFIEKEHVRVADTPVEFASAITELLNDNKSRAQMAARAYCYLITHYDCEANIHRLVTSLASQTTPLAKAINSDHCE